MNALSQIGIVTREMRRFMPNSCGDWADKIDEQVSAIHAAAIGSPLAPRRTVAEISRDLAALRTKADVHPGRSHLASDADQDAYCRLADHGLDLEHEWLASFERETGVDFNTIRSFL